MEPIDREIPLFLAKAEAYRDVDPSADLGVERIQTHISSVFLTRDAVYKVRKAIELPFIHFGSRQQRNADCLREVSLNRRLAPDVYRGVAPILRDGDGWRLGPVAETLEADAGDGECPEHCVVMRRLPEGRDALSLLERGVLESRHLDSVARVLAAFHEAHGLGVPAPFGSGEWLERVEAPVEANFQTLRELDLEGIPAAWIDRVQREARARFAACTASFEGRRAGGRVVDGHGDLHLDHLWFEHDDPELAPLLIDCIEFADGLRCIDAAAEVAFLAMDLAYRGQVHLAEQFLARYARDADDFGLFAVVDYYTSYRACVRAKVAALAAVDEKIDPVQRAAAAESAIEHLHLGETLLRRRRHAGVALMCGVVGSGKSTAAALVAEATGGVVVSSDRTRKSLAGLDPTARGGASAEAPREGLYSEARSDEVYRGLLERAAPIVDSGRVVVLDATFARSARREQVREWATRRGIPVLLVEVTCDEATALARLARRESEGTDPSDAGPALYRFSVENFETTEEWPRAAKIRLPTDTPGWRKMGREIAARFR